MTTIVIMLDAQDKMHLVQLSMQLTVKRSNGFIMNDHLISQEFWCNNNHRHDPDSSNKSDTLAV